MIKRAESPKSLALGIAGQARNDGIVWTALFERH
jgi:hypothetical protein